MGDLQTSLPAHFGFPGERAVKERGIFFLKSAKIHKTNSSPGEISAMNDLLKKVRQAGFLYADEIISTASGVPYVSLGRDIFVMTRLFRGREPDMSAAADFEKTVKCLADFHSAARNIANLEIPVAPPLCDVFEKQISALNATVKNLNRRPRLSDFDLLVLKNADAYQARAQNAANLLAQTNYASLYAEAVKNSHICHSNLKEETFTLAEDGCYISRFEDVTIDLQLSDFASVLRRFARKSKREVPLEKFFEIYGTPEHQIIRAMLLFPTPFMKIVSQFYSKKRNFIPAAVTERMTGVLAEQDAYDAYI